MPEETFDLLKELSSRRKALTVTDLADALGISRQAVYEYVKQGSLPAIKIGSTIRLNPRDVALWLESKMTISRAEPRRAI